MGMNSSTDQLREAIIRGDHRVAEQLTRDLLQQGMGPKEILDISLMPGMEEVGKRFRGGTMFLPHVLTAARAMSIAMTILEPLLSATAYTAKGTVLLGTVKGDVHDIGKNLVGILLRGAGYNVVDLGVGCTAEQFLAGFEAHHPDVVGLSALLTTTMIYMKTVIEEFRKKGIRVPIILGGAPITKAFAEQLGAAGTARNGSDAVELVRTLINRKEGSR